MSKGNYQTSAGKSIIDFNLADSGREPTPGDSIILRLKDTLSHPNTAVQGMKPKGGGEVAGPCPKCGGTDRFFIRRDGSFMCRQCGAKGGDRIDFFQWLHDTDIKGLGERYLGGPPSPPAKRKEARSIPQNLTAEYPYLDETGVELFRVRRYEEPGREKTFRQGHFSGGEWIPSVTGVRKVLYRLPEVLAADQVILVEGEKDVDNVRTLGLTATTAPCGADSWSESYTEALAGKEIAIIGDNDDAGRKHVDHVAGQLLEAGCLVRVITLSGLPEKGDVSDWIQMGGTRDELVRLIEAAMVIPALTEETPAESKPLFISAAELLQQPVKIRPLIGKIIERGCTGQIFGPSGDGKSFTAIDWACSVGTGSIWNSHQCEQGLVPYFAGEGHAGMRKRLKAWHVKHGFPAGMENVIISRSTITLDDAGIRRVIAEIRRMEAATGRPVALIVIDTLARHIDGDENTAKDMSDFIRKVETIRDAFPESSAFVVHHSGLNPENADRSRGSGALRGALDYEIQCSKGLLTFRKNKDGELPPPMEFKLVPVEVGIDEDGEPITSCYVHYGERSAKHREVLLTTRESELLELIKANPGILHGDLRQAFFDKRKGMDPDAKYDTVKKSFNRAMDGLSVKRQAYIDGFSVMPGQGQNRDNAGTCPEGEPGQDGTHSFRSVPMSHPLSRPVTDTLEGVCLEVKP